MSELIFHHYAPSPVSEKIRTCFGLKGLEWRSVEQNRLPDRPELMAMTGGYRRIPVLQVGADIYCDSQLILCVLHERAPTPTLFPNNGAGLPYALSRWIDGPMFELAFRVAFAPMVDKLPPALVADRQRLYIGEDGDMAAEAKDLPHVLAQLRPQLGWLETRLETGRQFVLGDEPGMPDLVVWYIVWFITERWEDQEAFFSEFPKLNAWAERMRAIGHGKSTEMTPAEALAVAKSAAPAVMEQADPRDPQGLKPGMQVSVGPVTNSGEFPVTGRVISVGRDSIAIGRVHDLCGEVAVHFPRVGYRVTIA